MKRIIIICLTLCITSICYAQNDWKKTSDSLALISRVKADIVLSKFDSIYGSKILYSLKDIDYYIVFQQNGHYKEYFVRVDSACNVLTFRKVDNYKELEDLKSKRSLTRRDKKRMKSLQDNLQTINNAFDMSQYSNELMTSIPNVSFIDGVPSYFVIKDEKDTRNGEYHFSSSTSPCPINPKLWIYLIKKISENY